MSIARYLPAGEDPLRSERRRGAEPRRDLGLLRRYGTPERQTVRLQLSH